MACIPHVGLQKEGNVPTKPVACFKDSFLAVTSSHGSCLFTRVSCGHFHIHTVLVVGQSHCYLYLLNVALMPTVS